MHELFFPFKIFLSQEVDLAEGELMAELEKQQATVEDNQSTPSLEGSEGTEKIHPNQKPSRTVLLEQLDEKKNELVSLCPVSHVNIKWKTIDNVP